jgi:hypothetical protein
MTTGNTVSIFVKSQLPDFVKRDNPVFVNFIETYYKWMEQFDNPVDVSRKLSYFKDADLIPEKYFQFMRTEFMKSIPVTKVDDRLLIKNILDFYRSRGTEKSYQMLFRILYGDENVSVYYPGKDILRASDGKWLVERSLKIINTTDIEEIEELVAIRGENSGATARKDKFVSYVENEVKIDELYINNVFGTFVEGEQIFGSNSGQPIGTIVDIIEYPGHWLGTDGFLSWDKYLQDNFFYQEYSYQIISSHGISEYEHIANKLVHPSGTKMFGAVDMFYNAIVSPKLNSVITVGPAGQVGKISINYDIVFPEPEFIFDPIVETDNFVTKTLGLGTQQIVSGDLIKTWANEQFSSLFFDVPISQLSKAIIFQSNISAFGDLEPWDIIEIVDDTNDVNTFAFVRAIIDDSMLILSEPYPYGPTTNLHFIARTNA